MNMSIDLKIAWLSLLALLALASTACGPQPALQDRGARQALYLNTAWVNTLDDEQLDLQFVSALGAPSFFEYTKLNRTTGVSTRCRTSAEFVGTVNDGEIRNPAQVMVEVQPSGADQTPCEWLKSISRYVVVGTQLVSTTRNNSRCLNGIRQVTIERQVSSS
jgi:hypothetical protein